MSENADPRPAPDGIRSDEVTADLVALAMGALDPAETERVRAAVDADPALGAELEAVEAHLELHDRRPSLAPTAALWRKLDARIEAEESLAPARGILQRFWMPIAAAALIAAAFFFQPGDRPLTLVPMLGDVALRADGRWACSEISRLALGDDIVITMDAGTVATIDSSPAKPRLALDAGRVHFRVTPKRRGFTVDAGDTRVVTTGTVFWVDRESDATRVGVAEGSVRVETATGTHEVAAGRIYADGRVQAGDTTPIWMSRPTLTANLLDAETIAVVIRNDMPDSIELAPPTGGEPLFYGHFVGAAETAGRDFPLRPLGHNPLERDGVTLTPRDAITLKLRLPRPITDREALFIDYPAKGVRVEANR